MRKKILITGSAGFIGFSLCKKLIKEDFKIIGIDNLNNYYDVKLKKERIKILNKLSLNKKKNWEFRKIDLVDKSSLTNIFSKHKPEIVINLAAQAGVRYSIENPSSYINSNIVGFANLIDCCKEFKSQNLLYASSSSVYGGNTNLPYSELDQVSHQVSLYAATKRSNEIMAHTYSHLYKIPATGLRLFTVYGPWGRPDMSPIIFADAIFSKKVIKINNFGDMSRSFSYIDDVIEIILKLIRKPALPDIKFDPNIPNQSTSWAPHRIFNIGNSNPIKLIDFINCLENKIGIKAKKEYLPMQMGDVKDTACDPKILKDWIGDYNETNLENGISKFIDWYKEFYKP